MRTKKILAVLMSVVMIFSAMPISAFADEIETEVSTQTATSIDNLSGDDVEIEATAEPQEETGGEEIEPTAEPSVEPTATAEPTEAPSAEPSVEPTATAEPSVTPSIEPSEAPTATPVPYVDGYTLDTDKIGGTYIYPVSARNGERRKSVPW